MHAGSGYYGPYLKNSVQTREPSYKAWTFCDIDMLHDANDCNGEIAPTGGFNGKEEICLD